MQRKISFTSAALLTAVVFLFAQKSPCQIFKYDARGKRDPFIPLIGALKRVKVSGLENVVSVDDIKLQGIAVGPGGKKTIVINGRMMKEGDRAGVVEILKIDKRSVTLVVGGAEYSVNLSKEGELKDELQN